MQGSISNKTTTILITKRLTAKQIMEYFPYMNNNLSAEYMAAILLGQKIFNIGKGLIQQWEIIKSERRRK